LRFNYEFLVSNKIYFKEKSHNYPSLKLSFPKMDYSPQIAKETAIRQGKPETSPHFFLLYIISIIANIAPPQAEAGHEIMILDGKLEIPNYNILYFSQVNLVAKRHQFQTVSPFLWIQIYFFDFTDFPRMDVQRGDDITGRQDKKILRQRLTWVLHQV
jgi:hypothetical protein